MVADANGRHTDTGDLYCFIRLLVDVRRIDFFVALLVNEQALRLAHRATAKVVGRLRRRSC